MLTVTFDNRTLTANQTTFVIDSGDSVSVRESSASKNQLGFKSIDGWKIYHNYFSYAERGGRG